MNNLVGTKKIFLVIAVMLTGLILSACGNKVHTYSTEDFIAVSVSGGDGDGTISIRFDDDKINERINADIYKGKGKETDLAAYLVQIYASADFTTDKKDELSNGDVVSIVLKADNEHLKEYGISFSENTYQYTVSGLEEYTELDLFEDVSLEYEGFSPYIEVSAVYNGSNEWIKENVLYRTDTLKRYANNDVVTVTASYPESTAKKDMYRITADEKEFTVSGIDEYVTDEFDTAELDKLFDDRIKKVMESSESFSIGSITSARGFFNDDRRESSDKMKILKQYIEPVYSELSTREPSGIYYSNDINSYKRYYKLSFDVEMSNKGTYSKSPMNEGDKAKSDCIWVVYTITNVMRDPDGNIYYDEENIKMNEYVTSLWGNYVGADLEEIKNKEHSPGYETVFSK